MLQKLQSDQSFKFLAEAFYETLNEVICVDADQLQKLYENGAFRIQNNYTFETTNVLRQREMELIQRCMKVLGPVAGDEKDIESLIWNCFVRHIKDNTANVKEVVRHLMESLHLGATSVADFISSNHVVSFDKGISKISIGPVNAVQAQELIDELEGGGRTGYMDLSVGNDFSVTYAERKTSVQLQPVCWRVETVASKRNRTEQAIWLINIALSLLRFCYPPGHFGHCPGLGDVERNPANQWNIQKERFFLLETSVAFGGGHIPRPYHIDENVVEVIESERFRENANKIFNAPKNSLAERMAQGLGWMTRGRQSSDRAERFLFFFTAIEALLSADDKSVPVVQNIARLSAVILSDDPTERSRYAQHIKGLYGTRSALVHSGKRNVTQTDVDWAQGIVEDLYFNVLDRADISQNFSRFQEALAKSSYGLPWPNEG